MTWNRNQLEERRMRFIKRFQQETSHGPSWAQDFGVHQHTIYLWRTLYLKQVPATLKATVSTGRPQRLTSEQERQVQQWLENPDSILGSNWTPNEVRERMGHDFGVWYHPCHLYKLLSSWGRCYHLRR